MNTTVPSSNKTWYTADLHFYHNNIRDHCNRPFGSVEEMNAGLIERWNTMIDPADTVWVLGDFSLSAGKDAYKLGPLSQLNGHKILVAGNHDDCWEGHRKWTKSYSRYLDAGFEKVYSSGIVENHQLGKHRVTLSHLPYTGDHHEEDRYEEHRPVNRGQFNLCGHVHTAWQTKDRMINVGVDVWAYSPVPEDFLIILIDQMKKGSK